MSDKVPVIDPKDFSNEPYSLKINKPWGYEIHWTPANLPYMGKILHINKDSKLSLQQHDVKQESWTLLDGSANVVWENSSGNLVETELKRGQGHTCAIGQKHRLIGITDCNVLEVSTPEVGTTWRLEDDYARPDETEAQRSIERSN